jgi:hypothetical protein
MPTTIFDILSKLGFGIGTILGALIAGGSGFAVAWFGRRTDAERESRRRREEYLIRPIVSFVDDQLRYIAAVHWDKVEGVDGRHAELLHDFRAREATVRARAIALGEKRIVEMLDAVDQEFSNYRTTAAEKGPFIAREHFKALEVAAGALIAELVERAVRSPLAPKESLRLTSPRGDPAEIIAPNARLRS